MFFGEGVPNKDSIGGLYCGALFWEATKSLKNEGMDPSSNLHITPSNRIFPFFLFHDPCSDEEFAAALEESMKNEEGGLSRF